VCIILYSMQFSSFRYNGFLLQIHCRILHWRHKQRFCSNFNILDLISYKQAYKVASSVKLCTYSVSATHCLHLPLCECRLVTVRCTALVRFVYGGDRRLFIRCWTFSILCEWKLVLNLFIFSFSVFTRIYFQQFDMFVCGHPHLWSLLEVAG
jgi:hypothetical protein